MAFRVKKWETLNIYKSDENLILRVVNNYTLMDYDRLADLGHCKEL